MSGRTSSSTAPDRPNEGEMKKKRETGTGRTCVKSALVILLCLCAFIPQPHSLGGNAERGKRVRCAIRPRLLFLK